MMIKNMVFDNRKIRSVFLYVQKNMEKIFEENFTHNINIMLHGLHTTK